MNKYKQLVIYLYNAVEDEAEFIDTFAKVAERKDEMRFTNLFSDSLYMANLGEENLLYVSPVKISRDFQNYSHTLMQNKSLGVIIPKVKTNFLCRDLLLDKEAYAELLNFAKRYKQIVLRSYVASSYFYDLGAALTKAGMKVIMADAPEPALAWTVNFLGSKSGIRQVLIGLGKELMPLGFICHGTNEAAGVATQMYTTYKGIVIKTNKGNGGSGVKIFREGDLPMDYSKCLVKLEKFFQQEAYWQKFPIVVERLIDVNYQIGGGFPGNEFHINQQGKIELLYECACLVTSKGEFYGVEIGKGIFPDWVSNKIKDTGERIAHKYKELGYRGFFDLDMIIDKNKKIFVSESNTRNTGGTDIYQVAHRLIGKDFWRKGYLINRSLPLRVKKLIKLPQILSLFKDLLYSPSTKEGIVVNSENKLNDKHKSVLYIIFAKDKKRAYAIENTMRKLLRSYTN